VRAFLHRLQVFLRRNFLAGLLTILPLVITIRIIGWLIDILEWGIQLLPGAINPTNLLPFYIPGLGALLTLGIIVLLGVVVSHALSQRFTNLANAILLRIPVFRGIYSAVKRLVEALLQPQKGNFRRVVLIEYPRLGMYVIGLTTGVTEGEVQERTAARLVNVFVPTTPNPTSGYYVLVPEEDIIALTMSVEEAFKLVMSGGIVTPDTPQPPAKLPHRNLP
jgi:uncharacterized membrane protein